MLTDCCTPPGLTLDYSQIYLQESPVSHWFQKAVPHHGLALRPFGTSAPRVYLLSFYVSLKKVVAVRME